MKRLQARLSLLTVLWVSVGVILFSALWVLMRGKSEATAAVAWLGSLLFVVSGAMFGSEVNLAIRSVNLRVDDCLRQLVASDARLASVERKQWPAAVPSIPTSEGRK